MPVYFDQYGNLQSESVRSMSDAIAMMADNHAGEMLSDGMDLKDLQAVMAVYILKITEAFNARIEYRRKKLIAKDHAKALVARIKSDPTRFGRQEALNDLVFEHDISMPDAKLLFNEAYDNYGK